jgi:hypothetical protein
MTTPYAILAASVILAAALIAARVIAPYEFASGVDAQQNPILWRGNTMTGDVKLCAALNVLRHVDPACQ